MTWIYKDPECGYQIDDFGGTFVYPDTGRTLANDSPESYFQVPQWAAWIFSLTCMVKNFGSGLLKRWDLFD